MTETFEIVKRTGRALASAGLAAALCFGGAAAFGGQPLHRAGSAFDTASERASPDGYAFMDLLPDGLDVIAVLNAPGKGWHDGGQGPGQAAGGRTPEGTLLSWMQGVGLLVQTTRSWSALADRLGMTVEEAGVSLLGGPVVVGWAGVTDAGLLGAMGAADSGWVLVSEVSDSTARYVRERLGAVPRRITSGYPVYSIDTGQTGLSVVRDGDRWRMVLAPVNNAELVDRTLAGFRERDTRREGAARGNAAGAPPETLATGTNAGSARALGVPIDEAWSVVVSLSPLNAKGKSMVVTAHGDADAFRARFATRGRYRHGAPVGVLDDIGGDALLSVAMAGEPWNGSDAIMLNIQSEDRAIDAPLRFDDGFTIVVRESGLPGSGQLTGVIAGWARSDDAFGAQVDRTISAMIGGDHAPGHRGRFPGAIRTHPLDQRTGGGVGIESPDESGSGQDAGTMVSPGLWREGDSRVAWCFTPDAGDRSGVVTLALGDRGTDIAGYARHGREAWGRAHSSGMAVDPDVVMRGSARPQALLDAMGMDNDPVSSLIGRIRDARWELRQDGDVLRGEVSLRLAPAKATLGGGR